MAKIAVGGTLAFSEVELIVFDKDGTLIDIHHYWASMIRLRARRLSEEFGRQELAEPLADAMGIDAETGMMKPEGPVGVKPRPFIVEVARSTLRDHGVEVDSARIEELFKEVDRETKRDLAPYLRLLPGVREFLEQSHALGVRLAIATTDLTERAREAMRTLGIGHYFSFIVGGDQVKTAKPAPDAGLLLVDQAGVSPRQSIMVGDHPVDIQMGKNCEMGGCVAVLTGLGRREELSRLGCHIVESMSELSVS